MTIKQLLENHPSQLEALGPDDKIQFIRLLRLLFPLGLYEAKQFADAIFVHPQVIDSPKWRRQELMSRLENLKIHLWADQKVLIDEVLSFINQAKL